MLRSRPDDRQRRRAEGLRRAQRSGANSGRSAPQIRPLPLGHRGQSGESPIVTRPRCFRPIFDVETVDHNLAFLVRVVHEFKKKSIPACYVSLRIRLYAWGWQSIITNYAQRPRPQPTMAGPAYDRELLSPTLQPGEI